MIVKSFSRPEDRAKFFNILGGVAQLALIMGIVLQRSEIPTLNFIAGILMGFSIVGNLVFITVISRKNKIGVCHD